MDTTCTLPEPSRSLSGVGKEARVTLSYTRGLPSVKPVIDKVQAFLESLEKAERPQLLLVVGDWGEGKTSIYHGVIEPWCEERGCCAAKLPAINVFNHFVEGRRTGLPPGDSLLYGIACASLQQPAGATSCADPSEAVRKWLDTLAGCGPILVYLDEFEDIVSLFDTQRETVIEVLQGLVQLVNLDSKLLRAYDLDKRLHIGIAVSRSAYQVLQSRGETANIWPRVTRRAETVELQKLTMLEAAYLLGKLVEYVYDGRLGVESLAEPLSLLNPVLTASLGLPGALEKAVNTLVASLRSRCEKGLEKLTLDNAPDVLELIEVNVEGLSEKVLLGDEYRVVEDGCTERLASRMGGGDKRTARRACRLVLLSSRGVRVEDVKRLVGMAYTGLISGGYAQKAMLYKLNVSPKELLDRIIIVVDRLAEEEPAYKSLVKRYGSPLALYRELLDKYAGYCSDGGYCFTIPYAEPHPARSEEAEEAELREALLRRLEEEGLLRREGEALIVPFNLFSRYVFSHEIMLLDFIEREERLEVWREARRLEPRELLAPVAALTAHALASRLVGADARLERISLARDYASLAIAPASHAKSIRVLGFTITVPQSVRVLVLPFDIGVSQLARRNYRGEHLVVLYAIGAPEEIERERSEIERVLGVPVITLFLTRSAALRLAGVTVWARRRGMDSDRLVHLLYEVLRNPSTRVEGLNASALYAALARIIEEHQLYQLVDSAVEGLRDRGILLPEQLVDQDKHVRRPEDLVDAAQWLALYPDTLLAPIPLGKLYDSIDEDVRRHMPIGRRARDLLRADIESARELSEKISALEALGVARVDRARMEVVYHPWSSPYVQRLLGILRGSGSGVPLQQVANMFIDKSGGYALQALLESLRALGLIEVGKAGNTPVLVQPDASRLIAETMSTISSFKQREQSVIERYGYLVFAKMRGYRVSLTEELVESIEARLKTADTIRSSHPLEALRLATAARKLAEHLLGVNKGILVDPDRCREYSTHVQLIHAAERRAESLLDALEARMREVEEQLRRAEDLINRYVASNGVKLVSSILDQARGLLVTARRFVNTRLNRADIEKHVKALWSLQSGERFPFYYRNERYCSNYKLWVLLDEYKLEDMLMELRRLSDRLRELQGEISRAVENARTSLEELRGYKEELERRGGVASRLAELISVPEQLWKISVDNPVFNVDNQSDYARLLGVVTQWRNRLRIEEVREQVERAKMLLEDIESVKKSVKGLEDEAKRLLGSLREAESILENVQSETWEMQKEMTDIRVRIARAMEALEEAMSRAGELLSGEVILEASTLEEAIEKLEKLKDYAEKVWSQVEERVKQAKDIMESVAEHLRELVEEALSRYSLAEKLAGHIRSDTLRSIENRVDEARRLASSGSLVNAARAYAVLASLPEPSRVLEEAGREAGLSREEIEVLAAVLEGRGRLAELERRLGEKVWEVVRRLYQRGFIDVMLSPRRPEA